jgi:hypothetical protein
MASKPNKKPTRVIRDLLRAFFDWIKTNREYFAIGKTVVEIVNVIRTWFL